MAWMRVLNLLLLAITPVLAGYSDQTPLNHDSSSKAGSSDNYRFKWPIKKVAVIGAGVGGLIAYRELSQAGFEVYVYERDNVPGGNWHYTDETPLDAPIPSLDIAVADYAPTLPPKGAKLPYVEEYHGVEENRHRKREHRAPKPVWESLSTNAPAPVQQIREFPWPVGTAWAIPNQKVQRYLRAFASWHGINKNDNNPNVSYNTRVELAEKRVNEDGEEVGWTLTLKTLVSAGRGTVRATWMKEDFDALLIATGRYNAPNIPNIKGLTEWNDRFPGYIAHSRQYRHPEPFQNQTVLVIGAGTSGGEISRDIIGRVKVIYQSVKVSAQYPYFKSCRLMSAPISKWPESNLLRLLPHNVTLIPEIKQFLPPSSNFNQGGVELVNGTIITGIDRIILATGYRYTYPFLPQYHNSSLGLNDTAPVDGIQPIVTDGTHLRSLYLDIFYIPDPTLTFINVNVGMQAFTYGEFLSLAIAKTWSGKADFPSAEELWRRYEKVYKDRKGYGKHFQFLGAERSDENLRFFRGWLNEAAAKYGGRQIDGLFPDARQISALWAQARLASTGLFNQIGNSSLGIPGLHDFETNSPVDGTESWAQDLVFSDYW